MDKFKLIMRYAGFYNLRQIGGSYPLQQLPDECRYLIGWRRNVNRNFASKHANSPTAEPPALFNSVFCHKFVLREKIIHTVRITLEQFLICRGSIPYFLYISLRADYGSTINNIGEPSIINNNDLCFLWSLLLRAGRIRTLAGQLEHTYRRSICLGIMSRRHRATEWL